MSTLMWLIIGMVVCLFIPSPLSAWVRAKVVELWNKIFHNNEEPDPEPDPPTE